MDDITHNVDTVRRVMAADSVGDSANDRAMQEALLSLAANAFCDLRRIADAAEQLVKYEKDKAENYSF